MKQLQTHDVAGILGESEYTVRAIANQYVFYIPATRIGSERFFAPEAVEVLRLIFEQMAVGVRDEYIEVMLSKRFPVAEVAVVGIPGNSSYQQHRRETSSLFAYTTGPSRDAWRESPSLSSPRLHDTEPEPITAQLSPPAEASAPALVTSDQDDDDQESLALEATALRERIEQLEQRMREIESNEPATPDRLRSIDDTARTVSEVKVSASAPPRRGFDDLASRESMAGD